MMYSSCRNSNNTGSNSNPPTQKATQKISLVKLLVGNGNSFFRAVELGSDFKTVLNSEKKVPDENDTDDISYTFPIDTLQPDSVNEPIDSVNYFKVTYYFDKGKLNEVDEDVYLENDSAAAILLDRLTGYLNLKYGDYAGQNDSRVWSTMRNGKKDWVSLNDQSDEYDSGKISLVFYSEEY